MKTNPLIRIPKDHQTNTREHPNATEVNPEGSAEDDDTDDADSSQDSTNSPDTYDSYITDDGLSVSWYGVESAASKPYTTGSEPLLSVIPNASQGSALYTPNYDATRQGYTPKEVVPSLSAYSTGLATPDPYGAGSSNGALPSSNPSAVSAQGAGSNISGSGVEDVLSPYSTGISYAGLSSGEHMSSVSPAAVSGKTSTSPLQIVDRAIPTVSDFFTTRASAYSLTPPKPTSISYSSNVDNKATPIASNYNPSYTSVLNSPTITPYEVTGKATPTVSNYTPSYTTSLSASKATSNSYPPNYIQPSNPTSAYTETSVLNSPTITPYSVASDYAQTSYTATSPLLTSTPYSAVSDHHTTYSKVAPIYIDTSPRNSLKATLTSLRYNETGKPTPIASDYTNTRTSKATSIVESYAPKAASKSYFDIGSHLPQ
ncbi:hypothetical protein DSO57_1018185 [Entomophthora muscae]|uniref:Uncharacterized protein n=1 Tax=Entomophthora muscae TaxID=34485 RepID=A0ACC2RIX9_9FUNG|nr:hypothetical protein DSO57_1018185 [Entomophthora muscae]